MHRIDHLLGRVLEQLQFLRRFPHALALQHEQRVDLISASGNALRSASACVHRQEGKLDADAFGLHAGLADVVDRLLHRVDRAGSVGLRFRRP